MLDTSAKGMHFSYRSQSSAFRSGSRTVPGKKPLDGAFTERNIVDSCCSRSENGLVFALYPDILPAVKQQTSPRLAAPRWSGPEQ